MPSQMHPIINVRQTGKKMVDHLHSKNLLPFRNKRNGFRLPGAATEEEEQMVEEVDPKLKPDEQGFVRHYLGFADVLLTAPTPDKASGNSLFLTRKTEEDNQSSGSSLEKQERKAA